MKQINLKIILLTLILFENGCSTLDQSIELGASLGSLTGGATTFAGYSAGGNSPDLGTVAIGAGVGAILGIATSYFTHQSVAQDRKACEADQIEMHFGDLPPSPFVIPKNENTKKKGPR